MTYTLVIGSSGFLGRVVTDGLRRGGPVLSTHHTTPVFPDSVPFDILHDTLEETLPDITPDTITTVVVCAGFESDAATADVERAITKLTAFCTDKRLVYLSSDALFGGETGSYREDDPPAPRTLYGRNLVLCETHIRERCENHVIIRPSYIYGFSHGTLDTRLARTRTRLERGETVTLYEDMFKSPLGVEDVAEAVVTLSRADVTGTFHVAGPRRSVFDFQSEAMRALGVNTERLRREAMPKESGLLHDTTLDSTRWQQFSGRVPASISAVLQKHRSPPLGHAPTKGQHS